jgi:hypothetical protein
MKISLIFTMETVFVVCEVGADVEETVDCLEVTETHTLFCAMYELKPDERLTVNG